MASRRESLERLQAVLKRFDVTIAQAEELLALKDRRFVIIADDSGSMQIPSFPEHLRARLSENDASRTRWSELREAVEEVVSVAASLGSDGVDVHFLNRPCVRCVRDAADPRLDKEFNILPLGGTPLTKAVKRFYKEVDADEEVLLFIFTDGEPNHGRNPFREALRKLVERCNVHVRIMALTEDEEVADWLWRLECNFAEVDFSDDFFAERREVLRAGLAPRFTRGDWCAKAMLAAVTQKFAMWDQILHRQFDSISVCDLVDCHLM